MRKILVANRGEIAVRIIRTLKKMGIASVAIYSEADRLSPHVQCADEAVCIGPAPSAQSYLDGERIISLAKDLGADGIHPGYGFLSENASFVQRAEEAGIKFIGPGAAAMRIMGSKLAAKEAVRKYNIPMVPGMEQPVENLDQAKAMALEIGYPVLIKASAGGGGKGMRTVEREEDLAAQLERAASEAGASFGDKSVFLEKYIASPRHIEIQVLADQYGNTIHLFERDCSIQRRHQKVVEESPSPVMTEGLRQRMGDAAVMVAKSCNYCSTGTVEFLVDEQQNFYFLEMNTRLQVEHPVTEMITGIDLVEEQIRVARGEKLRFSQDQLSINGHAVELRIYAEDPLNGFLPSIGTLSRYEIPAGEGIRVDDGYSEGMAIPVYYDPMIAKLIAHGRDRNEAIRRMKEAVRNFRIKGVETTLSFGEFVFEHESFLSGKFNTHFIQECFHPSFITKKQESRAELASLAALKFWLEFQKHTIPVEHSATQWTNRFFEK